MKTYLFSALILGITVVSCSKQKTDTDSASDSMSSATLPLDTSMALPPSDTAAMNASAPGRAESASIQTDSTAASTQR